MEEVKKLERQKARTERAKSIQQARISAPEYQYKEAIKKALKSRDPKSIALENSLLDQYIGYKYYTYRETAFEIRVGELALSLNDRPRLVYKSYWLDMISKMLLTDTLDQHTSAGYYSMLKISGSRYVLEDYDELCEDDRSLARAMTDMFEMIVDDVNIDHCLFKYKASGVTDVEYGKTVEELLSECG